MKVLYAIVATILLAICSNGQSSKVVDWPPASSEQAYVKSESGRAVTSNLKGLEIVEITVDGKPVVPGQLFSASDDWLRTFAVKIKNISEKPISSVRLAFGLPEAKSGSAISGFSLEYGKELSTGIDYGRQDPILPGQEVDLTRSAAYYTRDTNGIAKRTGITTFNSILIGVAVVRFDDGTIWSSYKLPMARAGSAKN
jgi:hypothetical protein